MTRAAAALSLLALLAGCGTYSLVRPADTLRAGQVEVGGGVAFAARPGYSEGPVWHGRAHVGLTDWLELGAQYEEYTAFGEMRLGVLSSERHGIALAFGVGGGAFFSWGFDRLWPEGVASWNSAGMAVLSATVGRRWGRFEVYVGDRFMAISPDASDWTSVNALKTGVRVMPWRWLVVGLEGGATLHGGSMWVGEGTLSVALVLGGRPRAPAPVPVPTPPSPPRPTSVPASLPAARAPASPPGDLAP